MVNASLNWASIVGIVLAVCGGGLYFLRSFKPALARDYDVFFSAIGLLCGGIFFFQGWRLDPIQQVGIFLLTGSTVFFAYESVRLRGVATDQARRSSYFEDEQIPDIPRNFSRNRFDDEYDQFDDSERSFRRFQPQEDELQEEEYVEGRSRRRNISRAIPESAVSRRRSSIKDINRFENDNDEPRRRRNPSEQRIRNQDRKNSFGERRASRSEVKRGSRPSANQEVSRESNNLSARASASSPNKTSRSSFRSQTKRETVEDAAFSQKVDEIKKPRQAGRRASSRSTSTNQTGRYTVGSKKTKPRDNSSRFDD